MTATDSKGRTGIAYADASYTYTPKTFPSACTTETGCIIQQRIYDSKGLKLTRQYDYIQTTIPGDANDKWWSSYQTAGTYINGDAKYTYIIPGYSDNRLGILDDYYYSGKTDEKTETQWVFKDTSTSYGMEVYICYEQNSD